MSKTNTLLDAEVPVANMSEVANIIYAHADRHSVITLEGQLGAGKTTLVRELLSLFGVQQPIISPTFNYMQVYATKQGKRVYHFDLYRLPSLESFFAGGFEEYLYAPNSITVIEWPKIIEPLLINFLEIHLAVPASGPEKGRHITIKEHFVDT